MYLMGVFYERSNGMELHEYNEFAYADELRPGGCYSGTDHIWTPTALGGSDEHVYTATMAHPTFPLGDGVTEETYHLSDNSAKLSMERTVKSNYLGYATRFLPAGIEIMQMTQVGIVTTTSAISEYGLFDSCETVELEVEFYPQLNVTGGLARLDNFQMELDFAAPNTGGSSYSLSPRLLFIASGSNAMNDPPDDYGDKLTQTFNLYFYYGGGLTRCTATDTGVEVLSATSEWATDLTTATLKLYGSATIPRKGEITFTNSLGTTVLPIEFNGTPLCHCTEGGSFRVTQEYVTSVTTRTPHNLMSVALTTS